jgi:hypothetical protein
MPDKAPSIGATYGTRPDAAEQMLATVRQASTQQQASTQRQASTRQQAATTQAGKQAGPERPGDSIRSTGRPVVARAAAHVTARNPAWPKAEAITAPGASWLTPPSTPPSGSKPTPTTTPKPTPKTTPKPTGPVLASNPSPVPAQAAPGGTLAGFDTCTAPSLPTMKAWRGEVRRHRDLHQRADDGLRAKQPVGGLGSSRPRPWAMP